MISNIFQPWYMFISQISKNGLCTFKQEKTTQRRSFINKRRKWKSIVKCKAWEILGNCIFRHFRRTNSFYCQTVKHREIGIGCLLFDFASKEWTKAVIDYWRNKIANDMLYRKSKRIQISLWYFEIKDVIKYGWMTNLSKCYVHNIWK